MSSGSPDASGHPDMTYPPDPWASAPIGSKGQATNLIKISIFLFPLLGMSADIPLVQHTLKSLAAQRI